jgi:hypothetical protein
VAASTRARGGRWRHTRAGRRASVVAPQPRDRAPSNRRRGWRARRNMSRRSPHVARQAISGKYPRRFAPTPAGPPSSPRVACVRTPKAFARRHRHKRPPRRPRSRATVAAVVTVAAFGVPRHPCRNTNRLRRPCRRRSVVLHPCRRRSVVRHPCRCRSDIRQRRSRAIAGDAFHHRAAACKREWHRRSEPSHTQKDVEVEPSRLIEKVSSSVKPRAVRSATCATNY